MEFKVVMESFDGLSISFVKKRAPAPLKSALKWRHNAKKFMY